VKQRSWDVFLCHASEDKTGVADPLAERLRAAKVSVWYDRSELTVGDSLHRKIDEGLAHSRYGVVILSRSFFAKHWPQSELDGLVSKEIDGQKVILPVWYGLTPIEVRRYSALLAGRLAARWDEGPAAVAKQLLKVIQGEGPADEPLDRGSRTRKPLNRDGSEKSPLSLKELTVFIDQSEERALRRQQAVRKAKGRRERQAAELMHDASNLLAAMRALDSGYRRIFGQLMGFDEQWTKEQGEEAKAELQEWLDQRIIISAIRESRGALQKAPLQSEPVRLLVASATRYLVDAIDPLLDIKGVFSVRQRIVAGLEQSTDRKFVRSWAKRVLNTVNRGRDALANAENAIGELRVTLGVARS